MPSRTHLLDIVQELNRKIAGLHELAIFMHNSEHLVLAAGPRFALLAHVAAVNLMIMHDQMRLFCQCVEDTARRLPES